ncbi:MAG TPA: NADP-dependent malic enzyme [Kiritimatiellia bacterium]|nr:NADP-dependent malic enzyme [Kiritimatiellia bacterium]HRZ12111.1 NADP-dependent malic enzyme [Kiritimatiellia bacterium]HSA18131.1 NADP-dependent malic enzyme [Kiritimatiellia bacterium]
MDALDLKLDRLDRSFPPDFTPEQVARGKTLFFKRLALSAHRFYGGKMQTVPRVAAFGFNWFNVWYTPGVSAVSTTIRDDHEASYDLSNRGNLVAVVSDSSRVLGDGDVSPSGGLGVMEGKAFLMKMLGGVDAAALCMDSRGPDGKHDPDAIIDFVRRLQPSFGAVNLEDIAQPNCYRVLDVLRESCEIPVWHDDAQGTGCVTLAGLLNALKVAGKELASARIVLYGAGASNTTIARLILGAGGDPGRLILFDTQGSLGRHREDIRADARFYRKWELCERTNPGGVRTVEEAVRGADALIALSKPGPGTVKPGWIRAMGPRAIVFACANPVPEIYPHAAKEAGAFVVATGRGDFPNQVNNSLGFPAILKGALLVRARKITDGMAIAAARSLAQFAEKKGLSPEHIIPTMEEAGVFPQEAADVAMQAVRDGVAGRALSREEVYRRTEEGIRDARRLLDLMLEQKLVSRPPPELLRDALEGAVAEVRGAR